MRLVNLLILIALILICGCKEVEEQYSYSVENKLDQSIQVSFYVTKEFQYIYENKNIDTLLNPHESVQIYLNVGGITCENCNATDHRNKYWDIDSLVLTIDDSTYYQFSKKEFWDYRNDDTYGYYNLVIDEQKIK